MPESRDIGYSPEAEWLEPDGLGGFASGTVGGARTRRYHALLLADASYTSPGHLLAALRSREIRYAIRLSLITTLGTLLLTLAFGLPAAWVLARWRVPGRGLIEAALALPMVLPPVVAGVALLVTVGARGTMGPALHAIGLRLPFTTLAVVLAQTFVAAPFFITSARAGFQALDPGWEEAARALGASRGYAFWRVVVPLTAPALVAGLGLTWARALGEFGATITFAGNLMGVTQTMPLAVYLQLEQSDLDSAVLLSLVLLMVSVLVLASLRDRWISPAT